MSDTIKVSTQVLVNTASEVRKLNNDLTEGLKNINKEMNSLESTWKSDAGNEIRGAMNALAPTIEQYQKVVESYAKFLVDTATKYEDTETAIQANASTFK